MKKQMVISGTLAKLNYPKYMKISELTTNQTLKELMIDFAFSKNNVKSCISLFRNGDIAPKYMRRYKEILIHYNNDIDTILQECGKLMLSLYPKYDKLEAIDGNKYSSWTNIRRYTTRDVFILAYVESLKTSFI